MVASSSPKFEELGSQGSLENEEVQVDHGRRARRVVERVALLATGGCDGGRAGCGLDVCRTDGGALDNGIDVVGHGCGGCGSQGSTSARERPWLWEELTMIEAGSQPIS